MPTVTVYSPDVIKKLGWRAWPIMVRDLVRTRELIWRLVLRDLSARYRQSILGYGWAIFPSIVTAGIFAYLSRTRVLPIGETPLPYVAYALWSIGVWQLFTGCLLACTNSLISAESLVTRINFPKEALVFGSVGQAVFDFLIRLLPVIIVFWWQGVMPAWQAIFLPIILVQVVLLALGIGFVLSIANLLLRDIGNALSIVLAFGMFLTPVVYPPPVTWPFVLINVLNPFSPLLIATQDLIATGRISMPGALASSSLVSVLVFLLGWRFFYGAIRRIAESA